MNKSLERANDNWNALKNPFFWFLISSYAKTNLFSKDHISKLKIRQNDNPIIQSLLQRIESIYQTFEKQYDTWQFASRRYAGYTFAMQELLNELRSTKIRRWDILVQVAYDVNTREYYELLPENRKPFQNGSIDNRILTVKQFANNLAIFPELVDLQTQVTDFYQSMEKLRDEQNQHEQNVRNASNLLKEAQLNLLDELFYNLSNLLALYYKDTSVVTGFFQMDIVRNSTTNNGEVEEEFQEVLEPILPNEETQEEEAAE